MKRYLILIFIICLALYLFSKSITSDRELPKKYYISFSDGNNTNKGVTPASPWKTISRVNSQTFIPGDSILFKCGDTWRNEAIEVDHSGKPSAYITYGSYGTGAKPRILGSIKAEDWTLTGTPNVWESATSLADSWTIITASGTNCNIFFEELNGAVNWGYHELYTEGFTNLTSDYGWTWNNNILYVYSATDPDTRFKSVEAPQRQYAASNNEQQYIAFDNIEFAYLAGYGIRDSYPPVTTKGFSVTNCHIHHIGRKGSNIAYGTYSYHGDAYYAFNDIHDCGRRSISIEPVNAGSGVIVDGILIENNHFHDGWHTTGVDLNTSGRHIVKNAVIRNNFFEGNPKINIEGRDNFTSNHMFIANQGPDNKSVTKNVWIYNNIFTYTQGKGIMLEGVDSVYIWNNTFYGFNPSLETYQAQVYLADDGGTRYPGYTEIKNNIFYHDGNNDFNAQLGCIKIDADWVLKPVIDYNLYYIVDPHSRFIMIRSVDNQGKWVEGVNLTTTDWVKYLSLKLYDKNSPFPADPQFENPPRILSLRKNSPARHAGQLISNIKSDFNGNEMNSPPDLGAIQFK
jgi:hypothetical protein